MPDMSGRTLGKYRLIERLGRGGMAEVYRAYQPSLDRDVAVKVMHGYMVEDEEFVKRFGREAKAVASLHHPHIVQMYDFDSAGDVYFMVMEYISGETLKARLEQLHAEGKRMEMDEVARIFRALCDALDYAHEQGCIHRDIKPANVMFEGDRLMLTDFGLATIAGGTRFTVTGTILGTPCYMSPEQGRGEPGGVTSDVYALGVMLYEVVAGQVPFDADTPLAIVYKHLNEPLPIPTQLNPEIPPAVEKVILKALAKDAEDRFPSAGALADALEAAIAGAELPEEVYQVVAPGPRAQPAPAPAASTIVLESARRKWLPFALGGVGLLIVAALIVAALLVVPDLLAEDEVVTRAAAVTSAAPTEKPGALPADATVHPEALERYERAVTLLFEAYDPQAALPELAQAIKLDPDFAGAYHMRGMAHQMMGEFDRAESDYGEAIARDPNLAAAYLDRGRLYMHDLGRADEALADISKAIELDPEMAPAYVERARLHQWQGQEERARTDAEHALELDPELPEALTMLGEFHYNRFECDEAIPYLARSVEVMPDDPWPWEMLGQCYHMVGKYDEALDTFEQALLVNRDSLYLYYGRAFVYLELGELDAALADFERALLLDAGFVGAIYGRGMVYAARGEYEDAIADFTTVIESDDQGYIWPYFLDTHPLIDRAYAHYELDRVGDALADLDTLMEEMGDWHIAYYHRGLLNEELGELDAAKADFEEAWRLAPDQAWRDRVEEELEGLGE